MKSLARMPALAAGVSSMGETTLMTPSSMVTSMPRPPNWPEVSSLHVVIVGGRQIARMRVERGQHALDGGADQLLLIGRIDIFGADAVEDFAEQVEVGIDLVRRRAASAGGCRLPQRRRGRRRRCPGAIERRWLARACRPGSAAPSRRRRGRAKSA